MAGTHIHIKDMGAAIAAQEVPGGFDADRKAFRFPKLEYVNTRGAHQTWEVRVELAGPQSAVAITDAMLAPGGELPPGAFARIVRDVRQVGGKLHAATPTVVSAGKNLGRANETNALTQALREALGEFNKQRRRGLAAGAPAEAPTGTAPAEAPTGTAPAEAPPYDPRPPPQLIKPIADAPLTPADFAAGVTVQPKLNGVHFVVYKTADGRVTRYSRTGAEYPGQDAIAAEMKELIANFARACPRFAAAGPPYFAGELYRHGESLNQISGQARRRDAAGDPELDFNIFDLFFPADKAAGRDMASRDRQAAIDEFFAAADAAGVAHRHVRRVRNYPAANQAAVDALAAQFIAEKNEGAVARRDAAGYRYSYSNYHSSNAVKIKPTFDAEFPVVGYTQGRGKDAGAVVWICGVPAAEQGAPHRFNVVPKNMTYATRRAVFRCLGETVAGQTRFARDVLGRPLTVEFKERAPKTSIPLQAKALAFRTYESGPDNDPIARLLRECDAAPP